MPEGMMVPKRRVPHRAAGLILFVSLAWFLLRSAYATPVSVDLSYPTTVARPTYRSSHPIVLIDAAHHNYHTADGFYRPFANLLRSDGYDVRSNARALARSVLAHATVLVIANARPPEQPASAPTFAADELKAVRDWVAAGGSLLLIADHVPFGAASQSLAGEFNVHMGEGIVFDLQHSSSNPTFLVFDLQNGLLGAHPILTGRSPSETVSRVVAFAGQSLTVPTGATVLLRLGATAYESADQDSLQRALQASQGRGSPGDSFSANARRCVGGAQGVALTHGRGRVVIVGEAALFSAQVLSMTQRGQPSEMKFGMNVPGNDDRQFTLNVSHWLSRAL